MDVHVTPENQASLDQIATATGRTHDAIVNEVLAGYLSELLDTRQTLNSRYDDLKSGRVQGIPLAEAFAQLRAEAKTNRASRGA